MGILKYISVSVSDTGFRHWIGLVYFSTRLFLSRFLIGQLAEASFQQDYLKRGGEFWHDTFYEGQIIQDDHFRLDPGLSLMRQDDSCQLHTKARANTKSILTIYFLHQT